MVCLLLALTPLLMSKAAGTIRNGGSAKSRPSAAGLTWAIDCLNWTVVYICLSASLAPCCLLFLEFGGESSKAPACLLRDMTQYAKSDTSLLWSRNCLADDRRGLKGKHVVWTMLCVLRCACCAWDADLPAHLSANDVRWIRQEHKWLRKNRLCKHESNNTSTP